MVWFRTGEISNWQLTGQIRPTEAKARLGLCLDLCDWSPHVIRRLVGTCLMYLSTNLTTTKAQAFSRNHDLEAIGYFDTIEPYTCTQYQFIQIMKLAFSSL